MASSQTKGSSYPVLYSSGIGSVSAAVVATPFDVVKNYLQVCIRHSFPLNFNYAGFAKFRPPESFRIVSRGTFDDYPGARHSGALAGVDTDPGIRYSIESGFLLDLRVQSEEQGSELDCSEQSASNRMHVTVTGGVHPHPRTSHDCGNRPDADSGYSSGVLRGQFCVLLARFDPNSSAGRSIQCDVFRVIRV